LDHITLVTLRILMQRAVDVDGCVLIFIEEVRARLAVG
jgi:hypothetical protein